MVSIIVLVVEGVGFAVVLAIFGCASFLLGVQVEREKQNKRWLKHLEALIKIIK